MPLLIIHGPRGAGKTTYLRRHVGALAAAGKAVGGIASPAVFEGGRRVGYDLLDLRHGARRLLARVVTAPASVPTVGPYRFDDAAIAAGNSLLFTALRDQLEVVAIDEVGPLELAGHGWAPALAFALEGARLWQQLVIVARSSLCGTLPDRFPSPHWATAQWLALHNAGALDGQPGCGSEDPCR